MFHASRCLINPAFPATLGGIQRTPWVLEKQSILPASLANFPFEAGRSSAEVENYPLIQAVRFRAVCEAVSSLGLDAS